MELLLNLTWLAVSIALGVLLFTSRRRSEAAPDKCVYTRSTAWISYVVLIALLLPAISMTDDLMAMVTPTDGEQIARRYEAAPCAPHHANLQVAILHLAWNAFHAPLVPIGNLETVSAFDAFRPAPPQHPDGRAPPMAA